MNTDQTGEGVWKLSGLEPLRVIPRCCMPFLTILNGKDPYYPVGNLARALQSEIARHGPVGPPATGSRVPMELVRRLVWAGAPLAERMRAILNYRQVTLEDVAHKTGVDRHAMWMAMHDSCCVQRSIRWLIRVAEVLDIGVHDLVLTGTARAGSAKICRSVCADDGNAAAAPGNEVPA